jgi:hypothetical protein
VSRGCLEERPHHGWRGIDLPRPRLSPRLCDPNHDGILRRVTGEWVDVWIRKDDGFKLCDPHGDFLSEPATDAMTLESRRDTVKRRR